MSAEKYAVSYNERIIALIYISLHPEYKDHLIGSIIPLEKKGKWEHSNLKVEVEGPYHDIFPKDIKDEELINELLARAQIEPYKVKVCKI